MIVWLKVALQITTGIITIVKGFVSKNIPKTGSQFGSPGFHVPFLQVAGVRVSGTKSCAQVN